MIQVTIYKNEFNEFVGFQTLGHAGYVDSGEDIVCAAASILVINTMNAIEAFTSDDFTCDSEEESGMIHYKLSARPTKEADLLLRTMILGLQDMEDDEHYGRYIDIIYKEV